LVYLLGVVIGLAVVIVVHDMFAPCASTDFKVDKPSSSSDGGGNGGVGVGGPASSSKKEEKKKQGSASGSGSDKAKNAKKHFIPYSRFNNKKSKKPKSAGPDVPAEPVPDGGLGPTGPSGGGEEAVAAQLVGPSLLYDGPSFRMSVGGREDPIGVRLDFGPRLGVSDFDDLGAGMLEDARPCPSRASGIPDNVVDDGVYLYVMKYEKLRPSVNSAPPPYLALRGFVGSTQRDGLDPCGLSGYTMWPNLASFLKSVSMMEDSEVALTYLNVSKCFGEDLRLNDEARRSDLRQIRDALRAACDRVPQSGFPIFPPYLLSIPVDGISDGAACAFVSNAGYGSTRSVHIDADLSAMSMFCPHGDDGRLFLDQTVATCYDRVWYCRNHPEDPFRADCLHHKPRSPFVFGV